ncbi:hypothetical protein BU16DRAFT_564697 [Lophium mytilinum]|uniref:F-box domain-containing protein n=1 Tax=Lophium mytilinum TaxID=390894 RepID=A0A6A6QJL5_9PEZI|nr:hypothetical protein BU16DRAFT_564697 [Lophium mytilinum]
MALFVHQQGPFFALPRELRDEIYQHLFCSQRQIEINYRILDDLGWGSPQAVQTLPVAFLRTCRRALCEALDLLYGKNVFNLQLTSSECVQFFCTLSSYSLICIEHVVLQLSAASFTVCKFVSDRMFLRTLATPDWGNPYFMRNLYSCFLSGQVVELRLKTDDKLRRRHERIEQEEIGTIIASTVEDVVKAHILKTRGLGTVLPASYVWESDEWDQLFGSYTIRIEEPLRWETDTGRNVVFRLNPEAAYEGVLEAKRTILRTEMNLLSERGSLSLGDEALADASGGTEGGTQLLESTDIS